jgi:hypothetical protein
MTLRGDSNELTERVVHMKHLIAENVVKDALGGGIGLQRVAIDGEAAGGRFLGDVKEGQHRAVRLLIDLQVIEAVSAGCKPVLSRGRLAAPRHAHQKRRGAAAEKHPVAMFVGGMHKIKPAQERIGCHFRGAKQIAAAVRFRFAEAEQLLYAARWIGVSIRSILVERTWRDETGDGIAMVSVNRFREHLLVEIAVGCMGCALDAFAVGANQQWLDPPLAAAKVIESRQRI